jgi:hypothetical protein
LNIPQHVPHHYGGMSSNSASHHGGSNAALFSLQGPTFQMPNTPSGSSANSSPPFSPIQMQPATHLDHRSHISNHGMSTYPQHANYNSVKVEDDHYASNHSSHHNSMQYSYSGQNNNMDWQTAAYSSERQHLHR